MTYRQATSADRDALIEMGALFMGEYRHTANVVTDTRTRVTAIVDKVLQEGVAVVAEDRTGMLVGLLGFIVGVHPITGVVTACECAWFVHPVQRGGSVGIRLIGESEKMALNCGAKRLQIGAPDDKVASLMKRLDYQVGELTFFKELV